ncbi:hypothetical protein DPMN_136482 [Dreissena polymorpha]|uniref:Uncharacterized protein n=1 Tax=Dreissena polymorpha TaxID=45954 RepID=A0A9D4JCQ3_DREPO|nr:hypothetical protein DPMN_136482 [Dreissena polymorpha]
MIRDFEVKKRKSEIDSQTDITFRIPVVLKRISAEQCHQALCNQLESLKYVGGIVESPYDQQSIKEELPGKQLIVTDESGLAVLKGAVMFGHKTKDSDPIFTTDFGRELLGKIEISRDKDIVLEELKNKTTFMFGDTELHVFCENLKTGKVETLAFDLNK